MENSNIILDEKVIENESKLEVQYIISTGKFIFLSIITFGLYLMWWTYKAWRFFKEKDNLDIMPALRTIFSIFFLIPLLKRILVFSKVNKYPKNYFPVSLFIGIIIVNLMSLFPDPFWIISIFSFVFYIEPFKALNYAKQNSSDISFKLQQSFNGRQVILIVLGLVLWGVVILG